MSETYTPVFTPGKFNTSPPYVAIHALREGSRPDGRAACGRLPFNEWQATDINSGMMCARCRKAVEREQLTPPAERSE